MLLKGLPAYPTFSISPRPLDVLTFLAEATDARARLSILPFIHWRVFRYRSHGVALVVLPGVVVTCILWETMAAAFVGSERLRILWVTHCN